MDANYLLVNYIARVLIAAMPYCLAEVNLRVRPTDSIGYKIIRNNGTIENPYFVDNSGGSSTVVSSGDQINEGDCILACASRPAAESLELRLYPPDNGGWLDIPPITDPKVYNFAAFASDFTLLNIETGFGAYPAYNAIIIAIDRIVCSNTYDGSYIRFHTAPVNGVIGPFHVDRSGDGGVNWAFVGTADPDALSFVDATPGAAQYRLRQKTWSDLEIPYNKVTVG